MISLNTFLYLAQEVIPVLEKGAANIGATAEMNPIIVDITKLIADLKAKLTALEGAAPANPPAPPGA